jgi:hypothetical protein
LTPVIHRIAAINPKTLTHSMICRCERHPPRHVELPKNGIDMPDFAIIQPSKMKAGAVLVTPSGVAPSVRSTVMQPKSTRAERVCERCGTTFTIHLSSIQRGEGRGRFCSLACRYRPPPLLPHPTDPTALLVPLTKGKVAVIDAADAPLVASHSWIAHLSQSKVWYACRRVAGKNATVSMHIVIMGLSGSDEGDHIDGDGLNNRRSNLRVSDRSTNLANRRLQSNNTSGFKGVTKRSDSNRWRAEISLNGKKTHLGSFDTAEHAALAYDEAARANFGEFARLNFPREGERGR